MNYEETSDALNRLHHLIKRKGTGTPNQLSKRFEVSIGTINNWIKMLRDKGLPIAYCREKQTYFYEYEVELVIFQITTTKI